MPVPVAISTTENQIESISDLKANAGLQDSSSSTNITLPARWMYDEKIFELEKRSIFSKVQALYDFIGLHVKLISLSAIGLAPYLPYLSLF